VTTAKGALGAGTVKLTSLVEPSISSADLSGSDFSFAPGTASEETIVYDVLSDWSATFSPPVNDLLLYAVFWRGFFAGPDPVEYTFDHAFSIQSGLAGASVAGTTLSLPGSSNAGVRSGILQFAGPVSSLRMTTNATGNSQQALTFGVPMATVPEPATFVLVVAGLLAMCLRRTFATAN
jgi:hypothetical protein